MKCIEYTTTVR